MNRRQVYFLLASVCLCALSLLFPPWLYEDENTSAVRSAGYHFRYSRPTVKSPAEMRTISGLEPTGTTMRFMWIHVDGERELGQVVALFFLTLGAILLSVQRRFVAIHVVGWVCVFAGVCVLAALIFYVYFLLS
jgi:hypothetical protein